MKRTPALPILTLLVCSVAPDFARAAPPVCVPPPAGVPGESGPPNWWDISGGRKDDPRWRGSTAIGHTADHARFLGLYANDGGQDYLYMSWEVRASGGPGDDELYIGFGDSVAGPAVAFQIIVPNPPGGASVVKTQIIESQVKWRYKMNAASAWTNWALTTGGHAPWVQDQGRYWVDCDSGICDTYHVQLRVPINNTATPDNVAMGVRIPDNFLFWYDVFVKNPLSTAAHHSFPEGEPYGFGNFFNSTTYPAAGDWRETQIKSMASCATGVNLTASQIFVTHTGSSPSTTINTDNTFHATPTNNTGTSLPGNAIQARFRIADWGSAGVGATPQWTVIPGACDAATGSTATIGDSGNFDLACDWNPDVNKLCDYRPVGITTPPWDVCASSATPTPSKHPHQCILVDLSAGPGATDNIFFNTSSTFRNMNLVTASKVEETALISVEGLAPIPGKTDRDVYLYVDTSNMPEEYSGAEVEARAKQKLGLGEIPLELRTKFTNGGIYLDDLAEQVPTFIVHAWHATGEEYEDEDGNKHTLLAPQPSFGMFLTHAGDLKGWAWRLEAPGLKMIAPNYFHLPVPMGGTAKLTTIIQAVEEGEQPVPANELSPPNPDDKEDKDPGSDKGPGDNKDPGSDKGPGDDKDPGTKGPCNCATDPAPLGGLVSIVLIGGIALVRRRKQ